MERFSLHAGPVGFAQVPTPPPASFPVSRVLKTIILVAFVMLVFFIGVYMGDNWSFKAQAYDHYEGIINDSLKCRGMPFVLCAGEVV